MNAFFEVSMSNVKTISELNLGTTWACTKCTYISELFNTSEVSINY